MFRVFMYVVTFAWLWQLLGGLGRASFDSYTAPDFKVGPFTILFFAGVLLWGLFALGQDTAWSCRNFYLTQFTERQPLPKKYRAIVTGGLEIESSTFEQQGQMGIATVRVTNNSPYPISQADFRCDMIGEETESAWVKVTDLAPGETTSASSDLIRTPFYYNNGPGVQTNCIIDPKSIKTPYSWWSGLPAT